MPAHFDPTTDIDLDAVVAILNHRGHFAYVEQTGGGCATIYAGPQFHDDEGYKRYAAVAGPGWFNGPGWTLAAADCRDFYIGADDDGESPYVSPSSPDITDVADLIEARIDAYRSSLVAKAATPPPSTGAASTPSTAAGSAPLNDWLKENQ